MASRREKFSSQPETLPIDVPVTEDHSLPPLDLESYRAFGSIPRLLGSKVSTLEFEQLDERAWQLTDPAVLEQGLFGREGGTAVNGLVLGAELYQVIIRNQDSFLASIQAKTAGANRLTSDPRAEEKILRSQLQSLQGKQVRHGNVLSQLEKREEILAIFEKMRRTPGWHKGHTELDLRLMATTLREDVFSGMLRALKDQHGLTNDDMIEMERALNFRLLKANNTEMNAQNQRIANWGDMLALGSRYTRAVRLLFDHSNTLVSRGITSLDSELAEFYSANDISPLGARATSLALKP